jgi:hypothetical protein
MSVSLRLAITHRYRASRRYVRPGLAAADGRAGNLGTSAGRRDAPRLQVAAVLRTRCAGFGARAVRSFADHSFRTLSVPASVAAAVQRRLGRRVRRRCWCRRAWCEFAVRRHAADGRTVGTDLRVVRAGDGAVRLRTRGTRRDRDATCPDKDHHGRYHGYFLHTSSI